MQNRRVKNLANSADGQDATTTTYVDEPCEEARELAARNPVESLQSNEDMCTEDALIVNQCSVYANGKSVDPSTLMFFVFQTLVTTDARETVSKSCCSQVNNILKQLEKIPKLRLRKPGKINVQRTRIVNLAAPTHIDNAGPKRYEDMLQHRLDVIKRNTLYRTLRHVEASNTATFKKNDLPASPTPFLIVVQMDIQQYM
ncbi:Protein of unknown function [Gryllus bimaculatus]|nr:Protein of unknown function [Gryllus bimaculatus]